MGLDRPALARTPGLRVLAAAGHRPRPLDDAVGRPAPLGAVRGLGGRGGARRVRGRARRSPRAGASSAPSRWSVRLAPLHCARRAGAAGNPVPAASRAATPPGPVAILTRATIRPRRLRRLLPGDRAAGASTSPGAPGLLASVGIGEWPVARQATFSLWRSLEDARDVRLPAPRAPRRSCARTRAERWYSRGAVRALPAVRLRGHLGRRAIRSRDLTRARSPAPRCAAPRATSGRPPPGVDGPADEHRPAHPAQRVARASQRDEPAVRRRSVDRAAGAPVSRSRSAGVRRARASIRSRDPEPVDQPLLRIVPVGAVADRGRVDEHEPGLAGRPARRPGRSPRAR